ncbi:MAG: hypothetical protein COB53_12335 [Elusimicrobia bacterium]|nr:MAG: hypothetical protein COB53_12335 [Elusimicrobiota bacterium]
MLFAPVSVVLWFAGLIAMVAFFGSDFGDSANSIAIGVMLLSTGILYLGIKWTLATMVLRRPKLKASKKYP